MSGRLAWVLSALLLFLSWGFAPSGAEACASVFPSRAPELIRDADKRQERASGVLLQAKQKTPAGMEAVSSRPKNGSHSTAEKLSLFNLKARRWARLFASGKHLHAIHRVDNPLDFLAVPSPRNETAAMDELVLSPLSDISLPEPRSPPQG